MEHRPDQASALAAAVLLTAFAGVGCRAPAPELGWGDPPGTGVAGIAPLDSADLPTGPLTLDQVVRLTLERNPDVQAAISRIGEAQARLREAESAFYPRVTGRLTYLGTDQPAQAFGLIVGQRRFSPLDDVNDPGFTNGFRPELVVGLSVFRGGADWYRREAARFGIEAREFERDAVRNALRAAAVSGFYLLNAAREQTGVAASSVKAVETAIRAARVRVAAGATLRSDVLSLEVRLAEAQEQLLRARNAVARGRAGLRTLLALPPRLPFEVAPPPAVAGARALPQHLQGVIELAHRHRPELAAVNRIVHVRAQQVEQEWAGHLPRVDLFGAYGHDDRGLKLSRTRDNVAVGVQVEVDLFGGFRTSARVRGARHRLDQARTGAQRARLEVEREATEAHLALQEARARTRVTAAAVTAAQEAFRLVRKQYEAGAVTVTRLLETEVALAGARSRGIRARLDRRRARAETRRAMGVWE